MDKVNGESRGGARRVQWIGLAEWFDLERIECVGQGPRRQSDDFSMWSPVDVSMGMNLPGLTAIDGIEIDESEFTVVEMVGGGLELTVSPLQDPDQEDVLEWSKRKKRRKG